jgi:hypothetical protein
MNRSAIAPADSGSKNHSREQRLPIGENKQIDLSREHKLK